MASFRRPNMSKINSAINKMKSANNQFQRDANRAIRELKSLESKVKTEQRKLKSVSRPTVISSRSSVQHVNEIYDFLQENYIMSAEQIKKPAISTVGGLFDLFKVQGFFGISPKNLALGEQTLCSPSRHSNERAHQNR